MTTDQTWLDKPTEPGLWWLKNPNGSVDQRPLLIEDAWLRSWEKGISAEEGFRYARCDAKPPEPVQDQPRVVCLCGSTRFHDTFQRANYDETMAGRIVLTVGHYPHSPGQAHGESVGCTPEQKVALDALHKRKIDLADEVLVLNVGGYVGESTRSEIEYAQRLGKPVRWLEPVSAPDPPEPVLPDVEVFDAQIGGVGYFWRFVRANRSEWCYPVRGDAVKTGIEFGELANIRPMHADADELRERAERGKVIASLQTQLDTRTKTYASTLGELENAEEALVAAGIEMGDQYGPHQSVAEGIAELADASKHWHAATQQNADLFVDNETMRLDKERLEAEVADLRKQPPDRQLMADVERFLKCASTPPAGMPSDGFVIHGNNAGRLELLARVRQASDPVPQRHNYADIAWRLGDCLLGISNVYWDSNANKYRTSPHPLSEELARTQFEKMRTVLDSMTTPNAKVGLDILHDALRDSNASDPVKPPMTTELVERLRRAIYLMGICEEQIDRDKVRALLADLEKVSDPPLSKGLRERCIDDLTAWRNSFCRKNPNCGAPETDQLIADLQAEPEDDHDYTSPPLKVVGTMKCGPVEPDKAGESKPLAQRVVELERLYEDLILQVANKHPGESRHATAKRYISEHELGPAPPKRGPVVTAAMLERWDVVLRCSPTMNELVQLRAEMRAARDKLREGGG